MKALSDIRNDLELQKRILWDLTPEQNFRSVEIRDQADLDNEIKRREAQAGYYFYIDVANLAVRLFLFENRADGTGGVVAHIKETPEMMLYRALKEAGGAITTSGHYPINEKVRNWLQKKLSSKEGR